MTETVRVGIVGLGNIAKIHVTNLEALDRPVSLEAGVDIDPGAREAFAARYGAATYEDPAEMYESVDAVLVATPNRFHEQYVVDALEAGLDVYVEKPLAHTVESAERIAAAAADAEGFCMVGFHNRFANSVEALAGYRADGTLGDVSHVEANYVRRRGVPGRGSWFTRKDVAGGGALIDIGAHAIDLSLHLLGYPEVTEVTGDTRAQFGVDDDYAYVDMWGEDGGAADFTVDDSASAFVRCANGATVSLEVAWATNRPDSQEYYVRGTDAGARLDLADDSLTMYETVDNGTMHHRTTAVETQDANAHQRTLARFVESVTDGTSPVRNTVSQALRVQRVMDAIYRSSDAGAAVSVDASD
ncbi:Gfo/Idh/MocA family protein [Haloarcula salina]|uniref:Gfo/Idh/MocA family oxidoreductase n=1 Tax=Haloarcula salina TaxID=1429914 RepID=A0AA41G3P7_9EURY|nr:Gfo/Idh/MocA family oxidoreductase [Haloarcula salina]MBV0903064.1 Gfo/Idh/MocA family oxidoreductase [Haloarcula salina]